jgi:hypothetical protein
MEHCALLPRFEWALPRPRVGTLSAAHEGDVDDCVRIRNYQWDRPRGRTQRCLQVSERGVAQELYRSAHHGSQQWCTALSGDVEQQAVSRPADRESLVRTSTRLSPASRAIIGGTAQAIAVVLHELAINAAKYGALSGVEGQVTLDWSQAPDGSLTLHWTEKGGPMRRLTTSNWRDVRPIRRKHSAAPPWSGPREQNLRTSRGNAC